MGSDIWCVFVNAAAQLGNSAEGKVLRVFDAENIVGKVSVCLGHDDRRQRDGLASAADGARRRGVRAALGLGRHFGRAGEQPGRNEAGNA